MDIGTVRKVDIDREMQQSYLDYAMSVIVSRALPDARDGLKPVQRRILYGMYDMGLRADSGYKKSARIVGEVLGKYHPHGDAAVYEAMARMAQDFSMRNPIVDGQGNFGSIDGDPPAAMRYTEARLTSYALELLNQIDRNTVDFSANFDESLDEPVVLPAGVPNLLVNGASGIAVGMATNIPPHNLGEVIDACSYLLKHWSNLEDLTVEDLMKFIKGPDFPTGGLILQESGKDELASAYATGKGRILVRGRMHLEEMTRGKTRLIISELPYQTNKASLIERIAELVREGSLTGISDLRDESDRQGMRIVIELSKAAEAEEVMRELYRKTPLEVTFGISILALVGGEPRLLSLKQALKVYLNHRLEVIKRRSEYDLAKAQARAHILEGLRIAIKNLDDIIALIKSSADAETARLKLIKKYKLSDIQAQAILDMPLKRLAALERRKIEEEYRQLLDTIKHLTALLKSPKLLRDACDQELQAAKNLYADKRRTLIVQVNDQKAIAKLLTTTDLTPAEPCWVALSSENRLVRFTKDETPRLSGKVAPRILLHTNTHQTLYLVAENGKAAALPVHAVPESEKITEGIALNKATPFSETERIIAGFALPVNWEGPGLYVLTVSRLGLVKKTDIAELPGASAQLFNLVKVNQGDALINAGITNGMTDVYLFTSDGFGIRFSEEEIRPMGLIAAGVAGIKLNPQAEVISAAALLEAAEFLLLSSQGAGWRMTSEDFPLQGRYGQGVVAAKLKAGEKLIGLLAGKKNASGIALFKKAAGKGFRLDEIPLNRRGRAGQSVLEIKPGDSLVEILPVVDYLLLLQRLSKGGSRKAKRSPANRK